MNNYLILRSQNSPYNDITKNSVLSFADMDDNLLFLKGNIIYTAITNAGTVTLKKYNGEDITFAGGGTFSGGTVSGPTQFIAGLTANTISASTLVLNGVSITGITNGTPFFLQNSPTTDAGSDKTSTIQRTGRIFVGDWNPTAFTGSYSFMGKSEFAIRHSGSTYINQGSYQNIPNQSGSLGMYRQRGTYQAPLNLLKDDVLGTIKFTTAAYGISGSTQWDNVIGVYANENHGGGDYGSSGGTRMDFYLTPNRTIGATKALSVIGSGDTRIFGNLTASTVSATTYYNLPPAVFSGGTVVNPTQFTGGLTSTTISATTYYGLPTDVFITGGTYSIGTAVFTNNTGGTFSVSGFSTGGGSSPISVVNTSSLFSTGLSNTGLNASGVTYSLFFGPSAGSAATNADNSNFFGSNAGAAATNASFSNFIGAGAGGVAVNAPYSNFLGFAAGGNATNARHSNFFGKSTGQGATNASYSTLIGYYVGYANGNSIGTNNIIIGTNITLSAATTDSINIGGVLFGTGTYSATAGDPSISANTSGRIGIGVVTPTEKLHVSGNLLVDGNLTFTGQSRNPIYSAGTVTSTHIPNWNNSNIQTVILSAATTNISGGTNIANGAVYTIILKQNASGSRVVNWGSQYKWQSGIAPVLTSTANAVDILTFISDGTNLYGLIAKDFR